MLLTNRVVCEPNERAATAEFDAVHHHPSSPQAMVRGSWTRFAGLKPAVRVTPKGCKPWA
jgi:hypothetical protein